LQAIHPWHLDLHHDAAGSRWIEGGKELLTGFERLDMQIHETRKSHDCIAGWPIRVNQKNGRLATHSQVPCRRGKAILDFLKKTQNRLYLGSPMATPIPGERAADVHERGIESGKASGLYW
jgi:hypothetical protein